MRYTVTTGFAFNKYTTRRTSPAPLLLLPQALPRPTPNTQHRARLPSAARQYKATVYRTLNDSVDTTRRHTDRTTMTQPVIAHTT
jgi:hypothetical protein